MAAGMLREEYGVINMGCVAERQNLGVNSPTVPCCSALQPSGANRPYRGRSAQPTLDDGMR